MADGQVAPSTSEQPSDSWKVNIGWSSSRRHKKSKRSAWYEYGVMLYGIVSPLSDDEPSVRKDFWQVSDNVEPGAEYDCVLYNYNEVNNER